MLMPRLWNGETLSEPTIRMGKSELVDIVDLENRVVDTVTRSRMREERLLHRSTFILVFDKSGFLYVQKRTDTKDVYPGYWDPTTGGVVLSGEDYEAGAMRELSEELGITDVPLKAHFDFLFKDGPSPVWGRVFSCHWNGVIIPQPEEVQSVQRMRPDAILERATVELFTPDSLYVVKRWVEERMVAE